MNITLLEWRVLMSALQGASNICGQGIGDFTQKTYTDLWSSLAERETHEIINLVMKEQSPPR